MGLDCVWFRPNWGYILSLQPSNQVFTTSEALYRAYNIDIEIEIVVEVTWMQLQFYEYVVTSPVSSALLRLSSTGG